MNVTLGRQIGEISALTLSFNPDRSNRKIAFDFQSWSRLFVWFVVVELFVTHGYLIDVIGQQRSQCLDAVRTGW
jgi:hypothetical protein